MSRMLDAALKYAAIGWYVFPLTPHGKRKAPHPMLGPKGGHHLATTDEKQIREWWGRDPNAGIGVSLQKSGIFAVDLDPRNGGDQSLAALEAEHGPLLSACVQETGGGGRHFIFLWPVGVTRLPGKIAPGLDIKANGYICIAPTRHESGRIYRWPPGNSPIANHELIDFPPAWVLTRAKKAPAIPTVSDDPFADLPSQPIELDPDELRAKLMSIPTADTYEAWLMPGQALHHQFRGDEAGLDLWIEWSRRSIHFDEDECRRKWESFQRSEEGGALTARYILKLAKEHEKAEADDRFDEIRAEIAAAATKDALLEAARKAKRADFDQPTRAVVAGLVKDAFKRVTGVSLGIQEARDLVRREDANRQRPTWLEGWCYCTADDRFYNWTTRETMTRAAFDAAHCRHMLTRKERQEGKSSPEQLASHVALNLYQIPVVQGRLYMPGEETLFALNGARYVNRYTDRGVPAVPERPTARDRENVAIVQRHFEHLVADEDDRRRLLDWICYIVQMGRRPNFAVLLQGVEGDGKTSIGVVIGVVLGPENIRFIGSRTIEGSFNGWAEGQLLAVVEEVKLHGHNRYDILNQIKPLITNQVIEIHRKNADPYNVPNTTAYLLLTNFRDALPLTENDSRYFVVMSRWQTRKALEEFNAANPDYYRRLHQAIEESPGAIRGWLLSRPISPDFDPAGRAPQSTAKRYMAKLGKPEEIEVIEGLIADSDRPDMSETLLNATDLTSVMEGGVVLQTRTLSKMLSDAGFTYLGRFKVGGRKCRYWTRRPEVFEGLNDGAVAAKVRDWVETDL